jgi:hypothetical protein
VISPATRRFAIIRFTPWHLARDAGFMQCVLGRKILCVIFLISSASLNRSSRALEDKADGKEIDECAAPSRARVRRLQFSPDRGSEKERPISEKQPKNKVFTVSRCPACERHVYVAHENSLNAVVDGKRCEFIKAIPKETDPRTIIVRVHEDHAEEFKRMVSAGRWTPDPTAIQ